MKAKLRGLLRLSASDRRLVALAWLRLAAVFAAVRLLSFDRVRRWVAGVPQSGSRIAPQRLRRAADLAARHHLLPVRCLERSLALQWALARSAVVSQLRIGVRREGGAVTAHAWLEAHGRPLNELGEPAHRYVPLLVDSPTASESGATR